MIIDPKEVLLIDKPLGWTSFDVVKKLRGLLSVKKIGHAGTLDPLASGLLLLCIGTGTKRLSTYQGLDKIYEGTLVLGKTTPSFDLETPFDHTTSYTHLQADDIVAASKLFLGEQEQLPPIYSACKVNGVKAYTKARKGEGITLRERSITVHQFDITSVDMPKVQFMTHVSKGTYIRSLVHDFGQHLRVGAYLSALRRTAIGPYTIAQAYTIPWLEEQWRQGKLSVIDCA